MKRLLDMAWAAGLFEGEGSAYIRGGGRTSERIYLSLEIHMTDEDVVRRFGEVVGFGTVRGPYTSGGSDQFKPRWKWAACGAEAYKLARSPEFYGQLGTRRRARLAEIIAAIDAQPPAERTRKCKADCECGRHKKALTNQPRG